MKLQGWRLSAGVSALLAASSLNLSAAARTEIVIQQGDLYLQKPSGTPRRLTNDGHIYSVVVSPDTRWLAYNSSPLYVPGAFENHGGPSKVGVLALPSGARMPVTMRSSSEVYSSELSWSHDSTKLAWAENTTGGGNNRLVIFTPRSGRIQRLRVPVAVNGDGFSRQPIWNRSGQLAAAGLSSLSDASVPVLYTYTIDGHWRVFKRTLNRPAIEFGDASLTWLSLSKIQLVDRLGAVIDLDLATGQWK